MSFTKQELDGYRHAFMPLIGERIITGFNIYPRAYVSKANFCVNYLHAELTKRNKHRLELLARIAQSGLASLITNITNQVVMRQATYELEEGWLERTPKRGRFYDFQGNPVPRNLVKEYDELIYEGPQYDMAIEVGNARSLDLLLGAFDRYASRYVLDLDGFAVREKDKSDKEMAVYGAYSVPVVLVRAEHFTRSSFVPVRKFQVTKGKSEISTITTTRTADLAERLNKAQISAQQLRRLANRQFADWIAAKSRSG